MREILFGIPVVLFFIMLLQRNLLEEYPAILYTSTVVSLISLSSGFYMEYKRNKRFLKQKHVIRLIIAGLFIVFTWGFTLYQMFF